jgi:CTP:molybdopterin cytidylyltransferase MocA
MTSTSFHAVVLAGERPGGSALARELGIAAGVLADVAGQPCISRVLAALRASGCVRGGVICGPDGDIVAHTPALQALLAPGDFRWVAPQRGPAASALLGAREAGGYPVLLTGGDHALLEPAMVSGFCRAALARTDEPDPPDLVVGLVPHTLVARAFPESRRTVLRFADGAYCGSNLFALLGEASAGALSFWSGVEADRKRPWRIARRLGVRPLLRYLSGRLAIDEAFATLSRLTGCRVGWADVPFARAAVDVDSHADWLLANRLLTERAEAAW